MRKNPHAVALGRKGGKANSPAQAAVRARPKGGGRPMLYRMIGAGLERFDGAHWRALSPPYDAAAKAWLRRHR